MQMFTTQGGLAGLRAEGSWGRGRPGHRRRPSWWLPCPHGRDRGPREPAVSPSLHANSAKGKGTRRASQMFQSAV